LWSAYKAAHMLYSLKQLLGKVKLIAVFCAYLESYVFPFPFEHVIIFKILYLQTVYFQFCSQPRNGSVYPKVSASFP
jgi:hypothetical protein